MIDSLTTDEMFLNDLEGFLDLDGSFTPRPSTPTRVEGSNGLLGLLSDHGLNSASPSSTSDTSDQTKRSTKRENEKNRQRRYRQRLKDNRRELLRQANELSKRLAVLTQKASKKTKTYSDNDMCINLRWMVKVNVQRQKRLKSEEEKKMLLAAVNTQAKYIKELRQVVAKRINAGSLACQRNAPTLHSMTSLLYMTYLQQLEGCYARVDNVIDECGLVSMPETSMTSVHKRKADGNVAYFQYISKIHLLYSFQQVSTAFDRLLYVENEPALGGDKLAPDSDVRINTRVLRSENTGAVAQHCVLRQYKEEKRLVFVWKTASEGDGGFAGLHADETGWISVEPSETGVMMSLCVQQVPMRFSSADQELAIGKFYNLLEGSFEPDKQDLTERLGSLLLDDMVTGTDC